MGGKKSRRNKRPYIKITPQYTNSKEEVEGTLYVCEVCKKRFRLKSTLQLHRLIHKSKQTFSCDVCKEEFPFLSRLQKHCLLEHSNDLLVVDQKSDELGYRNTKPFACNICDKSFLVHDALKKHLSFAHENYNSCEEFLQNLTSTKNFCERNPAVSNKNFKKNNSSHGHKQFEAELNIKESGASWDNSFDPKNVCAILWDEGSSSCNSRNIAVNRRIGGGQEFSNDKSCGHVKPDRPAELCIKVEPDSFDRCITLSSDEQSSCSEESSDSTEEPFNAWVDSKKQFCCTFCNMKFVQQCDLQKHFRTHEPKQADYTPRFTSDQPLSSQPSGALGILNIGPYVCEVCNKGYVKNEDFKKHCLTHSEQNTYTCKVCSKQFARYSNFRAHCETHMKKNTFICSFCGTSFQFQKHLIDHQQMQSANAKLQCEMCDKKFDHSCSLTIHKQTHRGYHCEDCGSVFSGAGGLKRHQRSHANKRRCRVCGKTFATNDTLRKHLETHFGPKLYCCEICNNEFGSKHDLIIHRNTHQDMPHMCQLCNEGFLHAWLLRNHLLEHEANQDVEMWENCSLDTGEKMELPGKVTFKETLESCEEKIEKIIKKEKDF